MGYWEEYLKWCNLNVFNEETRLELRSLTDEKEIEDRFYKNLSFGTGGLRGLMGAGANRMNIYTVGKATQGLADFINEREKSAQKSVVIAFDSRNHSAEFALRAALVLCANGIKSYLFETLRPTPELSFAVRYLNCTAGIVVTASHNPAAYNGYKVYWKDGGQVTSPLDKEIIARVNAVEDFSCVKIIDKEIALEKNLLHFIGEEVDDAYIAAVKNTVLNPDILQNTAKDIKIVYTPLHGTGNVPVRRVLKELGFEQVFVVEEQALPDGNFPTVASPNPEEKAAFSLALDLAKQKQAAIVLATDPDADRLGVYVREENTGEYIPFTGNTLGVLLAEYRFSQLKAKNLLPEPTDSGALVSTIVSTKMALAVAEEYGLTHIEVLTGFKYIGEQIKRFEAAKAANENKVNAQKYAYQFLFGFEESYGCLTGTYARDKDAVAAVVALLEAAAYYKTQGMTLYEQMNTLYQKYGCYREGLKSVTLRGADGAKRIEKIMRRFRMQPPLSLGGGKVLAVRDYKTGIRTDVFSSKQSKISLPKSDVLYYELQNGAWCCVRPSGTEPKIKFYFGAKGVTIVRAEEELEKIKKDILSYMEE